MSQSQYQRQVSRRLFAQEFNDSTYQFEVSDDEMAPKYTLLPTGARVNRIFVVGTLTESDDIGDEDEYFRGRIVDPTGAFHVYAGQYQPDAAAFLKDVETPNHVALVGKPRVYETDEGNLRTAVRPEQFGVVDDSTKRIWTVETADRTLDRIDAYLDGIEADEMTADIEMAMEEYSFSMERYVSAVEDALQSITDTIET